MNLEDRMFGRFGELTSEQERDLGVYYDHVTLTIIRVRIAWLIRYRTMVLNTREPMT